MNTEKSQPALALMNDSLTEPAAINESVEPAADQENALPRSCIADSGKSQEAKHKGDKRSAEEYDSQAKKKKKTEEVDETLVEADPKTKNTIKGTEPPEAVSTRKMEEQLQTDSPSTPSNKNDNKPIYPPMTPMQQAQQVDSVAGSQKERRWSGTMPTHSHHHSNAMHGGYAPYGAPPPPPHYGFHGHPMNHSGYHHGMYPGTSRHPQLHPSPYQGGPFPGEPPEAPEHKENSSHTWQQQKLSPDLEKQQRQQKSSQQQGSADGDFGQHHRTTPSNSGNGQQGGATIHESSKGASPYCYPYYYHNSSTSTSAHNQRPPMHPPFPPLEHYQAYGHHNVYRGHFQEMPSDADRKSGGTIRDNYHATAKLDVIPYNQHGYIQAPPPLTPGIPLALNCDEEQLSAYQICVRKQLEIFEAQPQDVECNTQGRKKQVALGQVGIRCRHCAGLLVRHRARGAVYYPSSLNGVYQASQNMASSHLCESCQCIPPSVRQELRSLRVRRDTASGGKQYWADAARAMGLIETQGGLRLPPAKRADANQD